MIGRALGVHEMKRLSIQLFRLHSLCAQLLFESTNTGVLQQSADTLTTQVRQHAQALDILVMDTKPEPLVNQIVRETEVRLPDMFWIAELAQTATLRLLYRNTNIEDADVSEIMGLELTALLAARKGGIPEDRFMVWHRSMFADRAEPQRLVSELQALVVEFSRSVPDSTESSLRMIEPIDVKIPIIPGIVSIDAKKAVKAVRALIQKKDEA